jgi:phage FluMu protein Com
MMQTPVKCQRCNKKLAESSLRHHKQVCPGSIETREQQEADDDVKRVVKCPMCGRQLRRKTLNRHKRYFCPVRRFELMCGRYGGRVAWPRQRQEIREQLRLRIGIRMTPELTGFLMGASLIAAHHIITWLRHVKMHYR